MKLEDKELNKKDIKYLLFLLEEAEDFIIDENCDCMEGNCEVEIIKYITEYKRIQRIETKLARLL